MSEGFPVRIASLIKTGVLVWDRSGLGEELRRECLIASAWRTATSHLDDLTMSLAQQRAQARAAELAEGQAKAACAQQRATAKAAAATARAALHAHRVRHNEQTCQ
eukprot:COSAG06_NODE_29602_length_553_cov_1.211454_1_plen_105_part_10